VNLSVSQALAIEPLTRAKVIAGRRGMDRIIESVTIMDTPDIKNWVKGGELLLTNVFVIKDDPQAQVSLVNDLYEIGVAAIGVKVKRFVDRLPWEMLNLADELGLPIIEVPVECSWIEILNPVLTEILHRQAAMLKESSRIHDYFTHVALSGKGMTQLCGGLAQLTGSACALFNEKGELIAEAHAPDDVALDWAEIDECVREAIARAPKGEQTVSCEFGCGRVMAHVLSAGPDIYGRLVLLTQEPNNEINLTALEHAGTVATLEVVKQRAVLEAEKQFRKDFIIDLLNGDIESRETALGRARALGNWDFGRPHIIAVVDFDAFERFYLRHLDTDNNKAQKTRDQLMELMSSRARALVPDTVTVEQSDSLTLLIPADGAHEKLRKDYAIKELCARLKSPVRAHVKDVTVSIGIGRFYNDLLLWSKSYREARLAIEYGRKIWGMDTITHYNDLGVYRLVIGNSNLQEMWAFADEILAGLDSLEESQREQFLETLNAYFKANRSISDTAEAMFVHPNTIRHRLRRMEETINFMPDDPESCLNFEMALRIRSYKKSPPSRV